MVARLAERTPPERDRYVDFLRAMSILAVVGGHWLVATVQRVPGGVEVGNVLSDVPGLRPVTWVFQVMGVFFVVGGFSTRRAIEGRGGLGSAAFDAGGFFASRVERLLRPTLVFLVVWLVAAQVLIATPVDGRLVHDLARIAAQPLWFLAVYLLVTLIAPAQLVLHRRAPALLVVVLPVLAATFDILRFADVAPGLAVLNYLIVFAFAQELGFHLSAGWERIRPVPALVACGFALGIMVVLVTVGPYPVSMVGLPGARVSNMSPPTLCILLLTTAQTALLTALRPAGRRLLARPRVWTFTVAANAGIMTIFLWHLTAAGVVGGAMNAIGWLPEPATLGWWIAKIPWFIGCLAVLVPIVVALVGIERLPSWTASARGAVARRAFGVLLAVRGFAGFALTGFDHLLDPGGRAFLGLRLSPLADLLLVAAGYLLACGFPRSWTERRARSD